VEHVVFFPSPDGAPVFRRVAALEDAVRLVEHLRNVEGVNEVSVHPLGAEVPLAFRAWYRVELPGAVEASGEVPAEAPSEPVAEAPVVPEQQGAAVADPAGESVSALVGDAVPNGHVQDSPKSLGFFA
jgi:hypothetical protein